MLTRDDVLSRAADDCMKELYSLAQPSIDWDEFIKENKIYTEKYKIWEEYNKSKHRKNENPDEWKSQQKKHPDWEEKSITECIGPRPYEFYYLPREIMKDICDDYVRVYRMDSQQELLDTIETLKNYCKEPIVDKYIEGENGFPGHRGYDYPDNLEKELTTLIKMYCDDSEADFGYVAKEVQSKFFEFLDMAGNFYNWNRDLNTFNMTIYLGASPNSNKQAVIDNWKKYRKQDIEINEEQIKKDYYGELD
jgi:hypothetical protein